MSVYIPNMDAKEFGELCAEKELQFIYIPVPAHGRLIDADALKEKRRWTDDYYEMEYVEVEDIDDAPTIIPAEEEKDA